MKLPSILIAATLALVALLALPFCKSGYESAARPENTALKTNMTDKEGIPDGYQIITLGGGCYWCVEAVYQQLEGVHSVTAGFMGGHIENPTYEEVCGKQTGHIEVIRVVYDPETIPVSDILAWFWASHDPTTKDRQGNDVGPQYASAIFYESEEDKAIAEESLENAQSEFSNPIVTQIRPAETFYKAPADHQDYYFQNKNQGYCQFVIKPKLEKLKLKH
jgi:peptide-methionine (S)-S-oxide reductase